MAGQGGGRASSGAVPSRFRRSHTLKVATKVSTAQPAANCPASTAPLVESFAPGCAPSLLVTPLIPLTLSARKAIGTAAAVLGTRDTVGVVADVTTAAFADVGATLASAISPSGAGIGSLSTVAPEGGAAVEGR